MKWTRYTSHKINQGGSLLDVSQPMIMGIINVTPDSFYAGSRFPVQADLIQQVESMAKEGAEIIDLGAMSSRPGADILSPDKEWDRLRGIIAEVKERWPNIIISIDTIHSETASKCISEGADWINDISGGTYDSNMVSVVRNAQVPYICMHMRGTPKTMKELSDYKGDVVTAVYSYFARKVRAFRDKGLKDIIIDPGFGFAKNIKQNFHLLQALDTFHSLECPILVGLSRKSMIYKTLETKPEHALNGSTVLHTVALLQGAHILRVHDVREAREVRTLVQRLRPSTP